MPSPNDDLDVGPAGAALIKGFEQCRPKMYGDAVGKATIGCGHLVQPSDPFTKSTVLSTEEMETLFRSDLDKCRDLIRRVIKVRLNQNQFDALASFTFNTGKLAGTGLARAINEGRLGDVPYELGRWKHGTDKNGKTIVLKGLVRRRQAEIKMFQGGGTDVPASPPADMAQAVDAPDSPIANDSKKFKPETLNLIMACGVTALVGYALTDYIYRKVVTYGHQRRSQYRLGRA